MTYNVDKYLALCDWARARYSDARGYLIRMQGDKPSIYTRIEDAAANRYLGTDRRFKRGQS